MKLNYNFHTHTKRCGHAFGEDEEYVQEAIKSGFKELGFSDHISFKNLEQPGIRQKREELDDYVSSILSLKEKYKDQINIHLGFEAEYIEEYLDDYRDLMKNHNIEYLICGQHSYILDNQIKFFNTKDADPAICVTKYVDDLIKAMQCGLFKYIAHPDHFMDGYLKWDEFSIKESTRLIEAAEKYDMPLEINCGGLRYAYYKHKTNPKGKLIEKYYPYPAFWDLVSKYNVRVVIGKDAHTPLQVSDDILDEAFEFAKKHNLKVIEDFYI